MLCLPIGIDSSPPSSQWSGNALRTPPAWYVKWNAMVISNKVWLICHLNSCRYHPIVYPPALPKVVKRLARYFGPAVHCDGVLAFADGFAANFFYKRVDGGI